MTGRHTKFGFGSVGLGYDTIVVTRHLVRLNELFELLTHRVYSASLHTFGIFIEVQGMFSEGETTKSGTRVRLYKDGSVHASTSISCEHWRGKDADELRESLATCMEEAFRAMADRASRKDASFDKDAFLRDTAAVLSLFRRDSEPTMELPAEKVIALRLRRYLDNRRLALILGDAVPPLGLPEGWSIAVDPDDEHGIIILRRENGAKDLAE